MLNTDESNIASAKAGSAPAIRLNNFDLIRLFAAFQVMNDHLIEKFGIVALYPVMHVLKFLPGVPVFFVVSGFLVSQSWTRAPSVIQYMANRALRIFPALWVCVAVSIPIALACGARFPSVAEFTIWLGTQLTVLQFYNPGFLRSLPTGGLNGSLWTIPVEIQFYVLLPVLAIVAGNKWRTWLAYAVAAAVLMMIAQPHLVTRPTMADKILSVSVVPYLFYFLVGVLGRQILGWAPWIFQGKFLVWASIYGVWAAVELAAQLNGRIGNLLSVPSIVLLGGLTVAAAFTKPFLAGRLLRHYDASYGIYVYHVPLINLALALGMTGTVAYPAVLMTTFTLGLLSWRFIEQPALSLKAYSSRPRREMQLGDAQVARTSSA